MNMCIRVCYDNTVLMCKTPCWKLIDQKVACIWSNRVSIKNLSYRLVMHCTEFQWCYQLMFFLVFFVPAGKEESVATFKGNEFFCYDLSMTPIQSSTDEITLSFRTLQRNGLMLHTGKSADYVNLSLKSGAVWLVINLGSGAFEALVEPVNGKFNDNAWHDVKVTRNLRQVRKRLMTSSHRLEA